MSIHALSQFSQIWSRATTALVNTPDAGSAVSRAALAGGRSGPGPRQAAAAPSDVSAATPFATLASNLQSVVLQLQAEPQGSVPGQTNPYGMSATNHGSGGSLTTMA